MMRVIIGREPNRDLCLGHTRNRATLTQRLRWRLVRVAGLPAQAITEQHTPL